MTGIEGNAFTVTEQGEGIAILLVHGRSNGPEGWDKVAANLAKRHRVLCHIRFTYRSEPPPAGAEAMAGEVHDVVNANAEAS